MKATITIEKKTFIDWITTALEGGSNYWYDLDTEQFKKELKQINAKEQHPPDFFDCLSVQIGNALYSEKSFSIKVYDVEQSGDERVNKEEPNLLGIINYESCEKALAIMSEKYPKAFGNLLEDYDANDADIFFQLAVMGEVVYG